MNPPPPPSSPAQDHPYPFEKPPPERPSVNQLPPAPERPPIRPYLNGIPIQEPTSPSNTNNNNRPWTRPYNPTANRRPRPPFKPLPNPESNHSSEKDDQITSKPLDTSTTTESQTERLNETIMEPTKKPPKYQPPLKPEKINGDNTLILGAELQPIPIPIVTAKPVIPIESMKDPVQKFEKSRDTKIPRDSSTSPVQTPSIIETISTKNEAIQPTRSTIEIQPSIVYLESTTESKIPSSSSTMLSTKVLEPSKVTDPPSQQTSTTPTEKLPVNSPTITTSIEHPTNRPEPSTIYQKSSSQNSYPYRPRPGIVLDDTLDYTKPSGHLTQRPFSPPRHPQIGDIFDVTVSAIQGPSEGNSNEGVRVSVNQVPTDVIVTSAIDGQKYVSIDGKRTYLNLFDTTGDADNNSPTKIQIQPSRTQVPGIVATGHVVPQIDVSSPRPNSPVRRPFHRRPTQPPVRIDTCIVGDLSTCDSSQHEACATVQGVSACHCKPGFARLVHSLPCKKVISIVVSIRVDRVYDWEVQWSDELSDKDSDAYQTISFESNRAIESAMSMTPFSDEYMGSFINGVYQGDISQGQGGVFVNATLKLTYESRTARPTLAGELQKHLLGVIHRRNNNLGNSAVFVDTPAGSISNLQGIFNYFFFCVIEFLNFLSFPAENISLSFSDFSLTFRRVKLEIYSMFFALSPASFRVVEKIERIELNFLGF